MSDELPLRVNLLAECECGDDTNRTPHRFAGMEYDPAGRLVYGGPVPHRHMGRPIYRCERCSTLSLRQHHEVMDR